MTPAQESIDLVERPILFSAPMIRALLDDRKTQTRRAIKPPRKALGKPFPQNFMIDPFSTHLGAIWRREGMNRGGIEQECPYGQPGDQLWVRENWRARKSEQHKKPINMSPELGVHYEADGEPGHLFDGAKQFPSIFMPRWASRLDLLITNVRIERLQDISEDDAIAEGATWVDGGEESGGWNHTGEDITEFLSAKESYKSLWDEINGEKNPWSSNPWVWIVEFKRIEKSIKV